MQRSSAETAFNSRGLLGTKLVVIRRRFFLAALTIPVAVVLASVFAADRSEKAALLSACGERPSQYTLSPDGFRALVDEFDQIARARRFVRSLGFAPDDVDNRLTPSEAARAFEASRSGLEARAEPLLPSDDHQIWKQELELYIAWEHLGMQCEALHLRLHGGGA